MERDDLLERIRNLSPEKLAELESLVDSLEQKSWRPRSVVRQQQLEALAAYAEEFGGTELDLDKDFEQAGIEHWLAMEEEAALTNAKQNE